MTLGQRIAQKRKEAGLSQEGLGEQLGVSRQAIYKWESGAALPEIDKLVALSRLFSVTVGWLLGLEETEAPQPAETPELTEEQLRLAEEIARRYLEEQEAAPQPQKRKWAIPLLFALCGVLLISVFVVSARLGTLNRQYNALQSSLSSVQSSIYGQISSITGQVEDILKSQNDLTADYAAELLSVSPADNTASFSLRAVPKTFTEGMTAQFLAEGDKDTVTVSVEPDGNHAFTGELTCPLSDNIRLSVVFIAPDGTRQTQLLDTWYSLYSNTLPSISVSDFFLGSIAVDAADENGTVTLTGGYVLASSVDASPVTSAVSSAEAAPASIQSVRMGLFLNRKLLAWGDPCDQPPGFTFYNGNTPATPESQQWQQYYHFSTRTVTLTQGDLLTVAAVVTDSYGRTFLSCDAPPYTLDSSGLFLWADSFYEDMDPEDWDF